ncbi:ATP-dependent metalloprotease FtsH [Candidatus Arthromitus sp. SFB-mouse-SU]|uniref:ATP-dependent zinc metalloprotease FtsH n=1 Tax=Candidatus Arthromitus sp. SFB-mouse TaxID=49118 RepID=UPI000254EEDE|nr:ATP-dependent zinc metalloprotease FtsH [Candidatus Arthromitus sp. SFB-mouse]EIA22195.1 ATP-dependent metalloprotease FtsH [Candidatus Arthromitus sp. SFB-1]EIA29380.1 ATP-dependent metalloprotease FtsH [Candidatus Arthromitus sp. SFB-co]EIA29684.1 ATP-dependent metalloprotease FtsH [Candidatus Arthromitus sp. SFB-mouse-SU]
MKKSFSNITTWIVIVVMIFIVGLFYFESTRTDKTIPYSKFEQYWINDEVQSIKIREGSLAIEGSLKNREQFVTVVPQNRLNLLFDKYPKNGEVVELYEEQSNVFAWLQFVPSLIIIVMSLGLWFLFMQQSQGGGSGRGVMNFGKSRAKMATQDTKKITFKEVAGAKEEKEELEEIVDFLREPRKYIEMGARIPKGVLLFGPPGTGKTLLAKAVAGEAGVPFFSISGSDFVEMFVGVGASRVRDLFNEAKKNSPCIIFIDEIDAVGRHRGAGLGGGHDEREQTLNQLLVEMDGFGVNEGIIIIAATNRPDILDPALLRPGRFDRQIIVGAPDVKGREEILKIHVKNKPLSEEIKLDVLAKRTPGFTGADLENLTNEASLLSVRRGKKFITMNEMEEAITRVLAGPEKKSKIRTEKTNKLTAYHEAGHAVVSRLLDKYDKVHEISIIPRGMAGGYTMHLPDEDKDYISKSDLEKDMISLLGGRVAEKLVLGDISTGAKNDIDRVSNIARKMVMEYGMSEEIGTISFGGDNEVFLGRDFTKSRNFSEELGSKIDKEIKKIVDKAYNKTQTLLSENISKLHAVAKALIEKEKLDGEEFEELFKNS